MKTKIISLILCLEIALGPYSMSSEKEQAKIVKSDAPIALRMIQSELANNSSKLIEPDEVGESNTISDKIIMLQEQKTVLNKLKNPSISLQSIRNEFVSRVSMEEKIQLIELQYVLTRMSKDKLDEIFQSALELGNYPESLRLEYELSYSLSEKQNIVHKMLSQDINTIKSSVLKKVGRMSRAELIHELEFSDQLLSAKSPNWKVVLIVVLSVAAAGLVSWAIVSASKKRWERKTREMYDSYKEKNNELDQQHQTDMQNAQTEHDQLTQDIINHWSTSTTNMQNNWSNQTQATTTQYQNSMQAVQALFDNRAYLRDNGFVWQVCTVTQTQVTQYCPYTKSSFSGTKVCSTYCLKNAQGVIAGNQSNLICANASVPANCNTPNTYDSGSTAGYHDGYQDGYDLRYPTHYNDAYNAAYNTYYHSAYNSGINDGQFDGQQDGNVDGYNDGYDAGYSDGLSNGAYDSKPTYNNGYNDGYSVGHVDGRDAGYNTGYSKGYSDGYNYALSLSGE